MNKQFGSSGCCAFTRGIYANMSLGREFTMRQLTGFGSPDDTNSRVKFALDQGATGLNILLYDVDVTT
jgi:methylmalonyl-CoA mutase N-terminal domain/subunit